MPALALSRDPSGAPARSICVPSHRRTRDMLATRLSSATPPPVRPPPFGNDTRPCPARHPCPPRAPRPPRDGGAVAVARALPRTAPPGSARARMPPSSSSRRATAPPIPAPPPPRWSRRPPHRPAPIYPAAPLARSPQPRPAVLRLLPKPSHAAPRRSAAAATAPPLVEVAKRRPVQRAAPPLLERAQHLGDEERVPLRAPREVCHQSGASSAAPRR